MASPNTTVTVNRDTANKLRRIGQHLEIPTAQVVARLADRELKALGLERPDLPELSVIINDTGEEKRLLVDYATDGEKPARYDYSIDEALAVAAEIRRCADGEQDTGFADLDRGFFTIERRGAAVIVANPLGTPPFRLGLNPARARLVATEIEAAAHQAQAQP